ncbi:phosphate ABC transporter membrane protein 1, PhoT family [Quadrisphaera granulorum]|uniref:Phosphate transport system permease protein n=1 Tax=Quadrisphaera granulorum TaxID=317664 RepID=A0A316A4C6_9ACTN|nr:phosphate ABC transporter permease subunit PstC [Quadrisphaera granulorum]PWJ51790.1 phosphate ABC transporter membrane protein 1 (PhoT family) [Quadrisphaera granulorum]SZE97737.1 phosphate ABC transporter membrane protein 1, PhoT family [Quadrisphaera granulorum]
MTATSTPPREAVPQQRVRQRPGDRIFAGLSTAAAVMILVILAGVAVFLVWQAAPALVAAPEQIGGESFWAQVTPLLFGTVLSAALALLIGAPLGVSIALFITHFAPRKLAAPLGYIIDLLAAIPSIVYGLWGVFVFAPAVVPIYTWLNENLGWFPLFAGPVASGRTMLTVGLVLAVMVLPVITALSREVFRQTPTLQQEAALALGATRWEMIKYAVIPYGKSGVVAASMLGLGRALGETMAVAAVLSIGGGITFNLISNQNPATIAANIALQFPESTGIGVNLLIATGLVLFVITFLVNFAARAIVARTTKG